MLGCFIYLFRYSAYLDLDNVISKCVLVILILIFFRAVQQIIHIASFWGG